MKKSQLKQIIKEVITHHIDMIDEAGDIAAVNAKIKKLETEIQEANQLLVSLKDTTLEKYVDPEIVGDMVEDLQNNIKELEEKKKELEEEAKKQNKTKSKPEKKEKVNDEK